MSDTDDTECLIRSGERALIVRGGFILPNGAFFHSSTRCIVEPGGGWVLQYDDPPPRPKKERKMEPTPEVAAPVSTPAPAPAPEHGPVSEPVTLQHTGDGIGQIMGFGEMFKDNPWAPLVIIVLAVIAVLGGRQGWKFYSERAAQNHELELKKLEMQAKVAGMGGAQPPPCQARDVEQDQKMQKLAERLEESERRLSGVERKLANFPAVDSDTFEDLEKRLKKAERAINDLKNRDDA